MLHAFSFLLKRSGIHIIVWVVVCLGCSRREQRSNDPATDSLVTLNYAKGFTVRYEGKRKWVDVHSPYQGASSGITYLLLPEDEVVPATAGDAKIIRVPLKSIVCTSTSHLPLLEYIGEANRLIGFPQTDYISSTLLRARVDSGRITDVGIDKSMNLELLSSLRPGAVMGYTMTGDYGQFRKIEAMGVPVVINAEYLEQHPLGRAEWIKYMALFFDKEQQADSIFKVIEHTYLQTKQLINGVEDRPTVLSGIVYGDAWFLPGGQNYGSRILRDAGCRYLWEEDTSTGFLQLPFEAVYEKAKDADYWIGVGSFETLKELGDTDHRYRKFSAFEQKRVYSYNAQTGAKGGSLYLELGYLRPDVILQDLVKITHPELLPGYTPYFHRRLDNQ